jgi:iron(II)-dependent oxidoreductase
LGSCSASLFVSTFTGEFPWPSSPIPTISKYKLVEYRHNHQLVERWVRNHTAAIQWSLFNGVGFVAWEDVFSIWLQVSDRDGEAIRRFKAVSNYASFIIRDPDQWIPHTNAVQQPGVYGSEFARQDKSGNISVWTLISRTADLEPHTTQLIVPYAPQPDVAFYDLYHGVELTPIPVSVGGAIHSALQFAIESWGYGAVTMLPVSQVDTKLKELLQFMAVESRTPLANYSQDTTFLPQRVLVQNRTEPLPSGAPIPSGMVACPASSSFQFEVSGMIYEPQPYYGQ